MELNSGKLRSGGQIGEVVGAGVQPLAVGEDAEIGGLGKAGGGDQREAGDIQAVFDFLRHKLMGRRLAQLIGEGVVLQNDGVADQIRRQDLRPGDAGLFSRL